MVCITCTHDYSTASLLVNYLLNLILVVDALHELYGVSQKFLIHCSQCTLCINFDWLVKIETSSSNISM